MTKDKMTDIVIIDAQKDFIGGALRNDKAIEATPKIVEFLRECMKDTGYGPGFGFRFYATRDTHVKTEFVNLPDDGDGEKMIAINGYLATLEGQKLPVEHCIAETDGWMIDDRIIEVLKPAAERGRFAIVDKPTFGSFDLAEKISTDAAIDTNAYNIIQSNTYLCKDNVLDEIILCGFCTDICVISNALLLRAKFPNTKITVMKDLCAGVTEAKHNAALEVMNSCQIEVK